MSGERITIDVDELTGHRRRLEQVGGQVDLARDAAGSTSLGGGAFGVLCSFLVAPLELVQGGAQGAIGQISSSIARAGTQLGAAAADLTAADQHAVDILTALQAELDRMGLGGGR